MQLLSLANATLLLDCIQSVDNNVTLALVSQSQRAFSIWDVHNKFPDIVTNLSRCLDTYNVSGTTSFIDAVNTVDDDYLRWMAMATEITPELLAQMPVRLSRQLSYDDRETFTGNISRQYLESGNINARGYESGGCDNLQLWSLSNYGVHGDCIDTLSSPITKSTDQLWIQTSPHHECRPKSSDDGTCHDDRTIQELDMTNAQCWNKVFYSFRVIRQFGYPDYWRDCKV